MKKRISILLIIGMLFSTLLVSAKLPMYDDIGKHWARDAIEAWSSYGIVNGYGSTFSPDQPITRGEFATVLNRMFGFSEASENTFEDLEEGYATEAILCLHHEGIILGNGNRIRPHDSITREEAGVMLCRALKLSPQAEFTKPFQDEEEISSWAKDSLVSLVNGGYFQGDNGCLRPKSPLTRAETITLLNNGIQIGDSLSSGSEIEKVCVIRKGELTLTDCVFQNDLFVSGAVTGLILENVSVSGTLHLLGDTEASVTLKSCTVAKKEVKNPKALSEDASNRTPEVTDPSVNEEIPLEESSDSLEELPGNSVSQEQKPTIETTLEDGILQKNSKKVFDVIARDRNGEKAECEVRCNGIYIEPSWEDDVKTSFTLEFTENGVYTIEITATDSEGIFVTEAYTLTYEMAEYGEVIGKAIVSVEAFTVGGGYIVAPMEVDVLEGVSCAYLLDELLTEQGLSYMSTGSLDGGFYLASVCDVPEFTPVISESVRNALLDAGYSVDETSYSPGQLSEFDFTQGSGWMYCVNHRFPNVGFSEYYLQDGDVMRIQFTLAYGSDIGGASGAGYTYAGDFYEIVNRDELTRYIVSAGIENCGEYLDLITKPDLTGEELEELLLQLP